MNKVIETMEPQQYLQSFQFLYFDILSIQGFLALVFLERIFG